VICSVWLDTINFASAIASAFLPVSTSAFAISTALV